MWSMRVYLCLGILFVFAAKSSAILLRRAIGLKQPYNFGKDIPEDYVLSAHTLSGTVVHFLQDQKKVDILDLPKSLGLTTLTALIRKANLTGMLSGPGPLTLLAPTEAAFNCMPGWARYSFSKNATYLTNALLYHILPENFSSSSFKDEIQVSTSYKGKKVRMNVYTDTASNSSTVMTAQCSPIDLTKTDIKASNGLVHLLHSAMLPPQGTIMDCIKACPVFKTLAAAINDTNLEQTLSGEGPFTLLAPTDRAFQKLPSKFLTWLQANTTALKTVNEYHIVPRTYCSVGLTSGFYRQIKTLSKENIAVYTRAGTLKVNDAYMIMSDGSVSNGVAHAIDTVLIPPSIKQLNAEQV